MDVGALLKQAREEALLSQRRLAAQLGIPSATVSRYESGAGRPSLTMLDRILAGCGKQLEATLVARHADLDAELDRLGAQSHGERCQAVDILTGSFLRDLAGAVLIGGAWAGALHGLPTEHGHGRLWLATDEEALERFSARMRQLVTCMHLDGQASSPLVSPALLRRAPRARWRISCVGWCDTVVVHPGEQWPTECRLEGDLGMLRVLPAEQLGASEGVRPDVLERWQARRG